MIDPFERRIAIELAARVRDRREALKWSQEKLGEVAGLHRTYVGAIERAEKNVTVITLVKLACAMRCSTHSLLPEFDHA